MAECSSSFIFRHGKKEESTELIKGCENSSAMVKFTSFEPESATANKLGTFKPGSVSKESLKTLQQFSGL